LYISVRYVFHVMYQPLCDKLLFRKSISSTRELHGKYGI